MVGVGVLGCGYWGPKLIRSLAGTPGFAMTAACDPREGRRALIRRDHPTVETLSDPGRLLERDDIQAVWIATPVPTHVPLARRALANGKHVLVEKPMATALSEAKELVDRAERGGLTLQAGHTFLFSPAVALVRKMISAVGSLCYITSERINPGPPGTAVSVLWDLAVHDVAIILDLIGVRPVSVAARGGAYTLRRLHEAVFLTLEFEGGAFAQVHASWMSSQKTRVMKVFGTRASLIYDDQAAAPVRLIGAGVDNRTGAKGGEAVDLAYGAGAIRDFVPEGPPPLMAECAAFLAAIQTGAAAPNSGRRALSVIEVLVAAEASLASGGACVGLPRSSGSMSTGVPMAYSSPAAP